MASGPSQQLLKVLKMNKKGFFRGSLVAVGVALSSVASAAVDISAETAAAKTDIASAGTLIIGVVVAIAVFAWLRKVIK